MIVDLHVILDLAYGTAAASALEVQTAHIGPWAQP